MLLALIASAGIANASCRDAEIAELASNADYVWNQIVDDPASVPIMAEDVASRYAACARAENDPSERAKLLIASVRAAGAGVVADSHIAQYQRALAIVRKSQSGLRYVLADKRVDPVNRGDAMRLERELEREADALQRGASPFEHVAAAAPQ
jgi:hypothetical protein